MSELEGHGLPEASAKDSASLERGYRLLLATYPRWFRRENEEEILAVLMACAQDDQTRPRPGAAVDLLKGAMRMRLRPRPGQPRTVYAAVRLMWLGALAELGALLTIMATAVAVRAAVAQTYPDGVNSANVHIVADEVVAPIITVLWLWLAWAHSKGKDPARIVLVSFLGLMTLDMIGSLAQEAATFAPADLIAGAVLWAIAFAAVVLIFTPASNRYFRVREPVLV
jgi:phosphatidylglycerophosphatase A